MPVITRITPATDNAGVMAGVSGSFESSSPAAKSSVMFVLAGTVAEGMTDVAKVEGLRGEVRLVEVGGVEEGVAEAAAWVDLSFCVELPVKVFEDTGEAEVETWTEEMPSCRGRNALAETVPIAVSTVTAQANDRPQCILLA